MAARAAPLPAVSRTKTAAPSPSDMPLRPLEKGRQRSGVITRRPSQARMVPLMTQASAPPTMARSTQPEADHLHADADRLARGGAGAADGEGRPQTRNNAAPSVVGAALGMRRGTLSVSGRVFST